VDTIKRMRRLLKALKLRTVIWSDSCHDSPTSMAQVHAEKCIAAEKLIPHDIVQMPWIYGRCTPRVVERLREEGFEVWAAPGSKPEDVKRWRRAVVRHGGQGMVLTTWKKCGRAHRDALLETIRTCGPLM
jgi:hypothetical protein